LIFFLAKRERLICLHAKVCFSLAKQENDSNTSPIENKL
jgi:hypothetical protein